MKKISDMLKGVMINPNKGLEERIKSLEQKADSLDFIIWVVLATMFFLNIVLILTW